MSNTLRVQLGLVVWLILFLGSLYWRFQGDVSGDGFHRGMERAMIVLSGQVMAAGLAVQIVLWSRRLGQGTFWRRAGQVPAVVTLLILAVGIWAFWRAQPG
ncbi:MAG: hypothetical protein P8O10_07400 [Pseudorhodobacter sp.]|nr:hypothetical protein [Pseudorhodobacter sp.]